MRGAQQQRGALFRSLHGQGPAFVMPNAWDAGSALMLASFDFPAIATTSAGIAFSLGLPDSEAVLGKNLLLDRIGGIARSVGLPVSADIQSGHGATPDEVAETVWQVIGAGAVGANIEDSVAGGGPRLHGIDQAVARIRAARRAADASGIPFVLTARTDACLVAGEDGLEQAVSRCNAYREAGADCLFVPGVCGAEAIGRLVRRLDGPLSVVMGLEDSPLTVPQLARLGVRRITTGGSLARAAHALVRGAAAEVSLDGTFSYAARQIPDAELSRFFSDRQVKERDRRPAGAPPDDAQG